MGAARRCNLAMAVTDILEYRTEQRQFREFVDDEEVRAQAVVDVVRIIGNVIGDGSGLGFRARIAGQLEVVAQAVFRDLSRRWCSRALDLWRPRISERPIVFDKAFEGLPSEVEFVKRRIAALEAGHHCEGLRIVVEPALGGEATVERALAGVAKGGVTEVVTKRASLREILVEAERPREGARNLGDFEGVREPCAVMVAFVKHEDLCLVRKPAERGGMDDAVAVAAELAARGARRLVIEPPTRKRGIGGIGRASAKGAYRHLGTCSRRPAFDGIAT